LIRASAASNTSLPEFFADVTVAVAAAAVMLSHTAPMSMNISLLALAAATALPGTAAAAATAAVYAACTSMKMSLPSYFHTHSACRTYYAAAAVAAISTLKRHPQPSSVAVTTAVDAADSHMPHLYP
jgi:hypothetical protein